MSNIIVVGANPDDERFTIVAYHVTEGLINLLCAAAGSFTFVGLALASLSNSLVAEISPSRFTGQDNEIVLTLLVPWMEPPVSGLRNDGVASSFICSSRLLGELLTTNPSRDCEKFCVELLDYTLRRRGADLYVEAVQLGRPPQQSGFPTINKLHDFHSEISVIMPHRGNSQFLDAALTSIRMQRAARTRAVAHVGIDEVYATSYDRIRSEHAWASFYISTAPQLGPFTIRQLLIENVSTELIAMQDSDDFSCSNRFQVAMSVFENTRTDILGCHELRLDEIDHRIDIIRYPIDVRRSLEVGSRGGLLHGTMIANRARFLSIGGLSTDRRIASDTQFKLRAYFDLDMYNVDEFLYIRRRHPDSLTNRSDTALGSRERELLRKQWERDFHLVRSGVTQLATSSLSAKRCHSREQLTHKS